MVNSLINIVVYTANLLMLDNNTESSGACAVQPCYQSENGNDD